MPTATKSTLQIKPAAVAERDPDDQFREGQPLISSITAKTMMAVTGGGLLLFVVAHMLGNLQIYLGQETLNAYAYKLKSMPLLLWTARVGLILIFGGHLALAFYLRKMNRSARSSHYQYQDPVQASLASRTMLLSGMVVFAFLIYHLLHFTMGVTDPGLHELKDSNGHHDVYSMVVVSFRNVFVSAAYIIAMLFLGLHLSHAISSMIQTFGFVSVKTRKGIEQAGVAIACILMMGNISIPVSVLLGLVGLPAEGVSP